MRLFDVSPNFPFTTSEAMREHGIYELPHELSNDVRLRTLGNQEISGERLNPIEYSTVPSHYAKLKPFVNGSKKLLKNRN